MKDLLSVTDAMNIDLKSFREDTYKKIQKAKLPDVLRTIETAHAAGCHVELTTLIVTGVNDSMEEMKDIISFIESLGQFDSMAYLALFSGL